VKLKRINMLSCTLFFTFFYLYDIYILLKSPITKYNENVSYRHSFDTVFTYMYFINNQHLNVSEFIFMLIS